MAKQHVEQYIVGLWDTDRPDWSTAESSFARRVLEELEGGRKAESRYMFPKTRDLIRQKVEELYAK